MNTQELAGLYREASDVRDETVRQHLLQALAQSAASTQALAQAKDDPELSAAAKEGGTHGALAERAHEQARAAAEAAGELVRSGSADAEAVDTVAAEAIAAEAIAAEAISVEAAAVEAAEGRFSDEPAVAENAIQFGLAVEGAEAVGSALRSFVAEHDASK
jgi:hypothetical protein